MDVDVAVVGGGPAGTVAARCLASWGWSVVVFERSHYDDVRYGETLPPEITPLLDRLDLRGELRDVHALPSPGTVSAWGATEPVESDFVRNPHGCGWHVDRARFDHGLARAAARAGAAVTTGVEVRRVERTGARWRVAAGEHRVEARFVVDAAGRGAQVAARRRALQEDALLALTTLLRHRGDGLPDVRTYVETTPRGWWYTAPVSARATVSMLFTDRTEYSAGVAVDAALEDAPLTTARVGDAEVLDSRVLSARSALREPIVGAGWLATGDSAVSYDPVSGRGVHKALAHGALAAGAAHRWLRGDPSALDAYAGRVRSDFAEYARTRRAAYAAERRWPDAGFWLRRRRAGIAVP